MIEEKQIMEFALGHKAGGAMPPNCQAPAAAQCFYICIVSEQSFSLSPVNINLYLHLVTLLRCSSQLFLLSIGLDLP